MKAICDNIDYLRSKGFVPSDIKSEYFRTFKAGIKARAQRENQFRAAVALGFFIIQESLDVLWERLFEECAEENDLGILHVVRDSILHILKVSNASSVVSVPGAVVCTLLGMSSKSEITPAKNLFREKI